MSCRHVERYCDHEHELHGWRLWARRAWYGLLTAAVLVLVMVLAVHKQFLDILVIMPAGLFMALCAFEPAGGYQVSTEDWEDFT